MVVGDVELSRIGALDSLAMVVKCTSNGAGALASVFVSAAAGKLPLLVWMLTVLAGSSFVSTSAPSLLLPSS